MEESLRRVGVGLQKGLRKVDKIGEDWEGLEFDDQFVDYSPQSPACCASRPSGWRSSLGTWRPPGSSSRRSGRASG